MNVEPRFYLRKPLLIALSFDGATNKPYRYNEILMLFKQYLFKRNHLFDSKDNLFVNCKNDPLYHVFEIERFHFTQVRSLINKCITVVPQSNISQPLISSSQTNSDSANGEEESAIEDEEIEADSSDSSDLVKETYSDSEDTESEVIPSFLITYEKDKFTDEVYLGDDSSYSSSESCSEREKKSHWYCVKCGTQIGQLYTICLMCWKVNRDQISERPKRKKKQKHSDLKEHSSKLKDFLNENGSSKTVKKTKLEDRSGNISVVTTKVDKASDEEETDLVLSQESTSTGYGSQDSFSCCTAGGNIVNLANISSFFQFLQTDCGIEWLSSDAGRKFLSSSVMQNLYMVGLGNYDTSPETIYGSSHIFKSRLESKSLLCSICFIRPKNGCITHGSRSHQSTCYQCARRLWKMGAPCPICRRKIYVVTRNFIC